MCIFLPLTGLCFWILVTKKWTKGYEHLTSCMYEILLKFCKTGVRAYIAIYSINTMKHGCAWGLDPCTAPAIGQKIDKVIIEILIAQPWTEDWPSSPRPPFLWTPAESYDHRLDKSGSSPGACAANWRTWEQPLLLQDHWIKQHQMNHKDLESNATTECPYMKYHTYLYLKKGQERRGSEKKTELHMRAAIINNPSLGRAKSSDRYLGASTVASNNETPEFKKSM